MVDNPRKDEEEPSSYPPGWPGIPGRSREHESHPETQPGRQAADAQVTESQREARTRSRVELGGNGADWRPLSG